ncbi:MAG: pentapeptide repeat-containing protein [Chloroflexota bacterium]
MDLENILFWGNTGTQWLQAGGWLIGLTMGGLLVYWFIEYVVEPFLRRSNRFNQGFSDLVQQGILIACIIYGLWQALTTLSPSFVVLSLQALFAPIVIGLTLLWFVLRLYQWATPKRRMLNAFLNQLVPILGLLFAVLWIGRFWITRPLTCIPNCTGQSVINADLVDQGLRGINLVDANLRGADLSGADLRGADLSGANLNTAVLRNANLTEASLIGTDLTGADLRGAILEDTDLSGAILSQADLTQVDLTRTALQGATLAQAKLVEAILIEVNLAGVTFTGANLTGANLTGANLHGAFLSGADLSDVTLNAAELTGALVNLSNLTGAKLSGANLAGASFIGTNLTSANLAESKLVGATLIGTNLKGADLRAADLTGTRLLASELLPSDRRIDILLFELNDLQTAQIITDANLNGVNFNQATVWPEGKSAFLANLLGELAVEASEDETEILPEEAVVDPDFLIIGQPGSASLNQAIIKRAAEENLETVVEFRPIDPSLAFGVLCSDETVAFVMTDHPIREAEMRACEANEQFPLEILVASEAFVLVAHPQNSFIEPLSPEQARRLLTAERWSEVDARWPSDPLQRYMPALETAELDLFAQWVDSEGEIDFADSLNMDFSSDPAERIRLLADDENGVAIVDYGTYLQNSDSLLLIEIEDLVLTPDTIASGDYLFVQPLYLYLHRNDLTDDEEIAGFLDFYLTNVGETAETVGYFPIDPDLLTKIQAAIDQAQAGELLLGTTIIETAAIASDAPVITDTVAITTTQVITLPQVTATVPLTTIVAVGELAVSPPLLAAYSQQTNAQADLSLSVTPLPQAAAWQQLCVAQTADLVMTTDSPPTDSCAADQLVAIPAGLDGIALIVHPDNQFANALTADELIALLFAETWSEANTAWPNDPITKLMAAPALYDHLVTLLAGGDRNLALSLQETAVLHESDIAQLVEQVADDPNGFGIVSLAAIRPFATAEAAATVQLVAVADQPIDSNAIQNGRYPFTRPLFLYATTTTITEKPFLRTFLQTYLTRIEETTSSLGYVPPMADQIERAQARLATISPAPDSEGGNE